jgi:hypothetical protein
LSSAHKRQLILDTAETEAILAPMATSLGYRKSYGSIILERFAATSVPAGVHRFVTIFEKAHAQYKSALDKAEAAEVATREGQDRVDTAKGKLDAAFDDLADALIGAKLAKRKTPLAGISKHSVTALKKLGASAGATEARAIVKKLGKAKHAKSVTVAVGALSKHAEATVAALGGMTKPLASRKRAVTVRDQAVVAHNHALTRLRKIAEGEIDDVATIRELFAPPPADQVAPRKTRAKKPKKDATQTPADPKAPAAAQSQTPSPANASATPSLDVPSKKTT